MISSSHPKDNGSAYTPWPRGSQRNACYPAAVGTLPASILSALVQVHSLTCAFVLSAFLSLSLRAFVLPIVDVGRHAAVNLLRVVAGTLFLGLGFCYALFTAPMLSWDA